MAERKRKFKSPESESRQRMGQRKGLIRIKEKRGLKRLMEGSGVK